MDESTRQLFAAAAQGDINAVRQAVAAGADVNQTDNFDEVGWAGYDPIEVAARCGHAAVVRELLALGSVNRVFVDSAIASQHVDVVREWLRIGERPDDEFDSDGVNLLMHAAGGTVEIVRLLVEHGANPNATSPEGASALSVAVARGNTPVIDYLRPLCSTRVRKKAGLD